MRAACTSAIVHPIRAVRNVVHAAPLAPSRTGIVMILGLGILYAATCLGLYFGAAEPLVPPVLPIALHQYYLWLALLTIPTFFAIWLAFSGPAHLVARLLGGRGEFRRLLDGTGVGLALPVFVTMWLPETAMAVALLAGIVNWATMSGWQDTTIWRIFNDTRQYGGGAWMLFLSSLAIRETERLSWRTTLVASFAGLIPAAAISYLVIR